MNVVYYTVGGVTMSNVIVCDECKQEIETDSLDFKKTDVQLKDKKFELIYYKCPTCQRAYVVCMLDYWGKKLQGKYVKAMDKYREAYNASVSFPEKLKQKLKKIEELKQDAMAYQNSLLQEYGNLIPDEVLR